MSAPIASFERVSKAFGSKVVYRELSLDVFEGETLVVMGGSGVGKSVLLKMLIRLLEVDGGTIRFRGSDVGKMGERELRVVRRKIAMLFQGGALFDSLNVGENVAYALQEHHEDDMSAAAIQERVSWALALVDLPGIEAMMPSALSGGMKKRVGLARAIALRPEVVLYDEPTTGLDPINTTRVNHMINGLKRALHVTSIVVTHDMASAFAVADRMAMVKDGRIVKVGVPEEFRSAADASVADFIAGNAPEHEDVETLLRG
ncbi:MAG: ATP-binding cassette domain-containing protein [Myxococcales bacterium]|nr:ATP-binding cassette domain-containing protein [Myxococcales bacterium]